MQHQSRAGTLVAALFVLSWALSARAAEPPRCFTAEGAQETAAVLGDYGAWLIQSPQRWDEIRDSLKKLNLKTSDTLGRIDFAKENLLGVFHLGDDGDKFSLGNVAGDEKARSVDLLMSYIIYKQRALTPPMWKLFVAIVPKSGKTTVTLATYHPMNGGPYPSPEKARREWSWTFSPATGEAIAGLTVQLEPRAATLKPGEDILLRVKLVADGAALPEGERFALTSKTPLSVWDNKYSNGYRNDAYEVVTPDGTTLIVQKPVINQWDKNVPHLIEIKPGKPYELVNWAEGDKFKSLKERGLDTAKPGKYAVTCIYQQTGQPAKDKLPAVWGGVVRSNTVVVEIK